MDILDNVFNKSFIYYFWWDCNLFSSSENGLIISLISVLPSTIFDKIYYIGELYAND